MQGLKVAGLAAGLTFVWSALIGLVFRFPVPFDGIQSGLRGMISAPFAMLLYGVFYGGLLVSMAIALLLYAIPQIWPSTATPRMRMWISANIGAFIFVMALATLDYVVGPW